MKCLLLFSVVVVCIIGGYSEKIILKTYSPPNYAKYYNYFPLKTKVLTFIVKCQVDAHVLLTRAYDYPAQPSYEIILGASNNTQVHLRKNGVHVQAYYKPVLNGNQFVPFSVTMNDNEKRIIVRSGSTTIIDYIDYDYQTMSVFGVATYNDHYADWEFDYSIFNCYN